MVAWERVIWVVLDSVGIGELPDAADYRDVGRNTLGHIAESRPLKIPNLVRLGLANIAPLRHLQPAAAPLGAYGKGATHSPGKTSMSSPRRTSSCSIWRFRHQSSAVLIEPVWLSLNCLRRPWISMVGVMASPRTST